MLFLYLRQRERERNRFMSLLEGSPASSAGEHATAAAVACLTCSADSS